MRTTLKFSIIILVGAFLISCIAPQPSKVCPPPDGKESWVCDKSAQLEVTPEQIYGWIFSASAIAAVTDVAEIQWICDFKKKIADWYVKVYPVSYDSVINKIIEELKLVKDPRKVLLIKNILNQNLVLFSNTGLIKEYDDWMMRAGSNKFDMDMMCGSGG